MNSLAKLDGLEGEQDADSCFADAICEILQEKCHSNDMGSCLANNRALVWRYIHPSFDPRTCPCTYTCAWRAFETFFDEHCSDLKQEEDKANSCVKWLHGLQTKITNLEAVDDLNPTHPYAKHRDRFAQISKRLDELTEFVMHKFRCSKFGV